MRVNLSDVHQRAEQLFQTPTLFPTGVPHDKLQRIIELTAAERDLSIVEAFELRALLAAHEIFGVGEAEGFPDACRSATQELDRITGTDAAAVGAAIARSVERVGFDMPERVLRAVFRRRLDGGEGEVIELPTARLVIDGNRATLEMTRTAKANAFNPEMIHDLSLLFTAAETMEEVTTIFLRGTEGKFSAGDDIKFSTESLSQGREGLQRMIDYKRSALALFDRIDKSEKRVVAVVDGYALGSGFELALAADDIVATPEARFAMVQTRLGMAPLLRGASRLAWRVGTGLALYFMGSGDAKTNAIDGELAFQLGVADTVVPRGKLEEHLRQMADEPARPRERPVSQLPPDHPLRGIANAVLAYWNQLADRREDFIAEDGRWLSSFTGSYPSYQAAFEAFKNRSASALRLAYHMMGVQAPIEMEDIARVAFSTPVALQALQTRGEQMDLVHRTRDEWKRIISAVLVNEPADSWYLSWEGPTLGVTFYKSIGDEAVTQVAKQLLTMMNEMNERALVNDIGRLIVADNGSGQPRYGRFIVRGEPGGPFILCLPFQGPLSPAAMPGASPGTAPASKAPSAPAAGALQIGSRPVLFHSAAVLADGASLDLSADDPPPAKAPGRDYGLRSGYDGIFALGPRGAGSRAALRWIVSKAHALSSSFAR